MKSNFLAPHLFLVTKSLLKSVRSSRQSYADYLKEEQARKKENEYSAWIEIIFNDILEIKKQIAECVDIIKTLSDEFWKLTV